MDALMDLEPILRSRKEQLTPHEVHLVQAGQLRAQRDFFVGSFGGAFVGWLESRVWMEREIIAHFDMPSDQKVKKSSPLCRMCRTLHSIVVILIGAGAITGVWLLNKSLKSTAEHLLSLQGTRVQGELFNLLMKHNRIKPWVEEQLFKYFYPEVVYTDASIDKPVRRWRYRNISGDPVTPQSTPQSQETDSKEKGIHMATMEARKAYVNAVVGENGNPFDLVFGHPESAEDVSPNDAPRSPSRRQARREKRQRRRHMRHHQEEAEI